MKFLTTMGGRKFALAAASAGINAVLVAAGSIDPETYKWVTLGIVGAYIAGNVSQHKADSKARN